jgi:vitamin B12 transporter
VVNLAGNYKVNGNVTAFARIDNLFNEHYQNPLGFERPGFGIFGGIRVEGQVPSAWIPTLPN